MSIKLGFIGTGNMGSALIKGISASGLLKASDIYITDIDTKRVIELCEETGVNRLNSNAEVVEKTDVIILAVKPNIVEIALSDCKDKFDAKKILVSVAAGVPIKKYKGIIGEDKKVIRVMPNTPALVGEGMTLLSKCDKVTEDELKTVQDLFNCVGKTEILGENLMSEVIALTSSSPAYIFILIEAMADGAVLSGIPRPLAYKLAAQAVLGSAKMVLETGKHPGELKDQVCSPAGTTIAAVASLEDDAFRSTIIKAMEACTKRALELAKL
ncbi:MAG: pyrroline-5-carboxylate reductase [Clostridiales bacterium]|jgi:pyrroline-5-carboxylate reductase|nr:pyrroline-5-carboxylate reductase [Clostridiales bacterium]